ncbi:sporulation integral membrane protein YtvI [Alkalicoccobacillus plakortidis]|uniref:Sporulation integral membrane protein YtvI n=1 Tax=Alkalicoccobacillus plakortidis TaxID=444060 RepID=A0ABT0XEX0_9BACI|nr:sporulation integral membrane protein YtvI [Alkalicoccobacillus plakortidis]MCM2674448.1 sporulation integral membrane protein YtvI [Alkalicoccobacillus plakortidis]
MTKAHAFMALRAVLFTITLIVASWLFIKLFTVTYPFWIAAFFAWMMQPLMRLLKTKLKLNSGFASLVGLLGGIIVVSSLLTGIGFLIYFSLRRFFDQVPLWIETGSLKFQSFFNETVLPFWQQGLGLFNSLDQTQQDALRQSISQLGGQLGNLIGQTGQSLLDWTYSILLGLPAFLVAFLFGVISIYFMGKSWHSYQTAFRKVIPLSIRTKIQAFIHGIRVRLFGFIRAQVILMFITAVIVYIGLLIIRVDGAFTLSIIVGLAELLPYLGTGTILLPWAVYLLISGDYSLAFGILILYAIIVVIRQMIEPKVLSSSLNLNPVAVLISMFAGLQLMGAVGIIVGPLILVLVMIFHDIGITTSIGLFIREGWKKE